MTPQERLIVAIDTQDRSETLKLLNRFPEIRMAKVGSVLFTSEGPAILSEFENRKINVFLDLKFHDIPNTVAGAVENVCHYKSVTMLTVHASGGRAMIMAAREAINRSATAKKPLLLAVTMLTSLDAESAEEIGFQEGPLTSHVLRLAKLATASGADGLVCSPQEIPILRKELPKKTLLVVPGIRPAGLAGQDDQKRTATPMDAIQAGADYLVIGRPITDSKDPKASFESICREIEKA